MKKIFIFLCLFMFMGVVSAKEITLDEMVDTINNGTVTKEFVKNKLELKVQDKKKYEEVIINAVKSENGISIMFSYVGDEAVLGEVNATLLEDGKTLQSIIRYHEDDDYIPEAEIEIHNMLVYWAIEASDSFKTIKEYVDSNYIQMFEGYFDKCYREEMHACRTNVISYGNYEYISDVELNEEPGKYVIVRLKEDQREEHNNNMLYMILIVGVVIGVLFLIAKMSEDKPKPIKY